MRTQCFTKFRYTFQQLYQILNCNHISALGGGGWLNACPFSIVCRNWTQDIIYSYMTFECMHCLHVQPPPPPFSQKSKCSLNNASKSFPKKYRENVITFYDAKSGFHVSSPGPDNIASANTGKIILG